MEPTEIAKLLAAHFPEDSIHWRAQTVTKSEPFKALALAYIDSRHVQDRLDAVLGVAGWQDKYQETEHGVRGGIGIRLPIETEQLDVSGNIVKILVYEWIWKWDAAPHSDIEGVKGGHSDAFKRAGVKWGIGRYLYSMGNIWVPCATIDGKFKKFTEDPWKYAGPRQPETSPQSGTQVNSEGLPEVFNRETPFWLHIKIDGKSWHGVPYAELPNSVCEKIADSKITENMSFSRVKAVEFANTEWSWRVKKNLTDANEDIPN